MLRCIIFIENTVFVYICVLPYLILQNCLFLDKKKEQHLYSKYSSNLNDLGFTFAF